MDLDTKNLDLKIKFLCIKKQDLEKNLSEAKSSYAALHAKQSSINTRIDSISFDKSVDKNIDKYSTVNSYTLNLAHIESFKLREQLSSLSFKVEKLSADCKVLEAKKSNFDSLHEKLSKQVRKIRSISNTYKELMSIEELVDIQNTHKLRTKA